MPPVFATRDHRVIARTGDDVGRAELGSVAVTDIELRRGRAASVEGASSGVTAVDRQLVVLSVDDIDCQGSDQACVGIDHDRIVLIAVDIQRTVAEGDIAVDECLTDIITIEVEFGSGIGIITVEGAVAGKDIVTAVGKVDRRSLHREPIIARASLD